MEPDGLCPLTCSRLRDRLADFNIHEDEDLTGHFRREFPKVKVFRRAAMVGTPYYPLIWDGDEEMVYPPTIRRLLQGVGLPVEDFVLPGVPSDRR